jgi:hypothetical protein
MEGAEFCNDNGHEVELIASCIVLLVKLIYDLVNFLLASLDMFPAYLFVIVL